MVDGWSFHEIGSFVSRLSQVLDPHRNLLATRQLARANLFEAKLLMKA